MSVLLPPLQPAELDWVGETPAARAFGDIYFSRENGLAESTHVFLDGNRLTERFAALQAGDHFVIGETGFGTGLNCLLAWQRWRQCAPAGARLFLVSTEWHPLRRADLARALQHWPSLATEAATLLAHYPPLVPGSHWLRLAPDVTLLLLLGDASETLPALHDSSHAAFHGCNPWQVDAWFLDGFAPAKNPSLWQAALFPVLASLSKPGTTLATFTSAGAVRRDLQAAGFQVSKVPGYGRKREMVVAQLAELPAPQPAAGDSTPWLLDPDRRTAHPGETVIVVGGGLAGCHAAAALAERGCAVTLLERHPALACEASGNAQGALYSKLSAQAAALSQYALASLLYAGRHYRAPAFAPAFHPCGLLQLQDSPDAALQALFAHNPEWLQWLPQDEASHTAGVPLAQGGWWLPQAGWLAPAQACAALVQHPRIEVRTGHTVTALQADGGTWRLQVATASGTNCLEAAHVVLACGTGSAAFADTAWLPLRPVRGQVSLLPATPVSQALRCVLCEEGYLAPAHNGQHCLGASFVPGDTDTSLREAEHHHNLGLLARLSPLLAGQWQQAPAGRAALRTTTPDHLPLVGPLPDPDTIAARYAALRHNARQVIPAAGASVPGLWLFTAFGGRGLCYMPLAAELLASQLLAQPRPLPRSLQMALSPARFVVRQLVREIGQRGRQP